MSDLYEHKKIDGKGYGCFALKDIKKGTLIVTESQKCFAEGGEDYPLNFSLTLGIFPDELRKFSMNILSAFNQMSQVDKLEFLKLNNNFNNERYPQTLLMLRYFKFYQEFIQNTIVKSENAEDKLNIIGIYITHMLGEKDGVFTKISQFNHSCKPNAFGHKEPPSLELIALKNIKAGQEITWAHYDILSCIYMLNKKKRQEELHKRFLVMCHCNHCDLDDTDSTTNYEELQELINEEELLRSDCNLAKDSTAPGFNFTTITMEGRPEDIANIKRIFPLEKCRKHLKKHGIEKKAQAPCMYDLLESGYRSAMVGFLLTCDYSNKKQYRDEALKFAKTALKFEKILPKEFVDPAKLKKNIEKLEKMFEFTTLF